MKKYYKRCIGFFSVSFLMLLLIDYIKPNAVQQIPDSESLQADVVLSHTTVTPVDNRIPIPYMPSPKINSIPHMPSPEIDSIPHMPSPGINPLPNAPSPRLDGNAGEANERESGLAGYIYEDDENFQAYAEYIFLNPLEK